MSGRADEAKSIWATLPESAPVVFNRGVAELFGGSAKLAIGHFKKAIKLIPESSGWHHLAQLYLAIAESRENARHFSPLAKPLCSHKM